MYNIMQNSYFFKPPNVKYPVCMLQRHIFRDELTSPLWIKLHWSTRSWFENKKIPSIWVSATTPHTHILSLTLSFSMSVSPLYSHHTLTFFGRRYGGPRCYISLANSEQRGAGLVCTLDAPSLKMLLSSCLQLSNSTHMRNSSAEALLDQQHHDHLGDWGGHAQPYLKAEEPTFSLVYVTALENQRETKNNCNFKVWHHVGIKKSGTPAVLPGSGPR